jgi:hypothetical protein
MPAPHLPKSLLSTTRAEFYDAPAREPAQEALTLTIKAGLSDELAELPADLTGSVFIVAPVGAIDSPTVDEANTIQPTKDGLIHLLNGDGMVYRIDLKPKEVKFSSRLMNTVTRYADRITQAKYPLLKFQNFGMTRLSFQIGTCNQSNTAFAPISTAPGEPDRLLVTWDMGRPIEIDPLTLRTIGPVGKNKDWRSMVSLLSKSTVMKGVMTAAHPAVVPNSGEVITINVVKSIDGLLGLSRLVSPDFLDLISSNKISQFRRQLLRYTIGILQEPITKLLDFFQDSQALQQENVYLLRWNAKTDNTDSWQVTLADGSPIEINQTTHQMGITEDYIVFADTALKLALEDILPSSLWIDGLTKLEEQWLEWLKFHRGYLTAPLETDTPLYLVKRSHLDQVPSGGAVTAQKVILKDAAIAHYQVDYDNQADKITLHAALNQSTDFAEFIHAKDVSALGDPSITTRMREMAGIFTDAMEVNRPVTYVINAKTGEVEHEATLLPEEAERHTWAMGIYAYLDSFGAWPETFSEFVDELYQGRHEDNPTEREKIREKTRQGLPTSLCRIHIDRSSGNPSLSVADFYEFPSAGNIAYFGSSPQFVPRDNAENSTDGYIICPVNYSDHLLSQPANPNTSEPSWSANTEIWIFDAKNLKKGPLYRLSHSSLNLGLTIHTTWLKEIQSPQQPRSYDVRQDFEDQVAATADYHSEKNAQEAEQLIQLFDEIYNEIEEDQAQASP